MIRNLGFTLIEILVALAIFSIIGLASTGVLTTVSDSNSISQERFNRLTQLQRAMTMMERDILQAVARPIRIQGETTEKVIQGGRDLYESDADGLGFVHSGWPNPNYMLPRSQLQAVAYRLREGNLERLYGNYLDNVVGFEPKIRVMLGNIEDFKVSFYTKSEDNDSPWQENYTGTELPKAVAIEITSKDFGLIRREFALVDKS